MCLSTCLSSCLCLLLSFLSILASVICRVYRCVCSSRPLSAKCYEQMSHFVICSSYHHRHSHDQRYWHLLCLCYVSVFVLHLYLGYISAITCSPFIRYILCVSRNNIHNAQRGSPVKTYCTVRDDSFKGSSFHKSERCSRYS